jgi:hypothetical protein
MRFLRVNVNGRLSKVYRYFTPYLRDTNELEPQSGLNGRADKVRLRIGRFVLPQLELENAFFRLDNGEDA